MNKSSNNIEVPSRIHLIGHSNFFKKDLIFLKQEQQWFVYKLDLEIPLITIHGEPSHPIAIDVDGGPVMPLGFKIQDNLVLDQITNKLGEDICLYFKLYEVND